MLRGLKYKVFEMKKTVLFVSLAAAALLLSSCFGKQESRYTYKCGFSFDPDDPYSGIPSSSFNSDSLYFPENGFSCSDFVYLGSKVSSDELSDSAFDSVAAAVVFSTVVSSANAVGVMTLATIMTDSSMASIRFPNPFIVSPLYFFKTLLI